MIWCCVTCMPNEGSVKIRWMSCRVALHKSIHREKEREREWERERKRKKNGKGGIWKNGIIILTWSRQWMVVNFKKVFCSVMEPWDRVTIVLMCYNIKWSQISLPRHYVVWEYSSDKRELFFTDNRNAWEKLWKMACHPSSLSTAATYHIHAHMSCIHRCMYRCAV